MKLRNLIVALAISGPGILLSGMAVAHSKNETTLPADGAVLASAPDMIGISFDMPMRLTLIQITDSDGSAYEVTRTDDMAPVTEFEATPVALGPGNYTVEWRGLSTDGHPMKGRFSFEITD